jgi:hypothetical protein
MLKIPRTKNQEPVHVPSNDDAAVGPPLGLRTTGATEEGVCSRPHKLFCS